MNEFNTTYTRESSLTFSEYLTKVLGITGLGLGISALCSFIFSRFYYVLLLRFGQLFLYGSIALVIAELGVAIYFASALLRMEKKTAWICYIVYSVLTGISLSSVVMAYASSTIWLALALTAVLFACMMFIGQNTRVDLSRFSSILSIGLVVLILTTIINVFFFRNEIIVWVLNYSGIVLFLILIAYDTQKLRALYSQSLSDEDLNEKFMIYGAFQLYLDFINVFLRLLEILGRNRSKK